MPSEHSHVMGGSTAEQRINCPLSYSLEAKMPEKESSEFADRGSMLHAAMEMIVVADPPTMVEAETLFEQLIGQNMGFEGHVIDQELIDTKIRPATEAWLKLIAEYDFVDWFIETRVSLEEIIPGAFGTADIIAIDSEDNLHCLDWKFGDGVKVEVKANYGAGFYALGALYDPDPELREFTTNANGVILHIVQPRANFPNEDALQTWETNMDWLENLLDLAIDAAEKAQSDDPPAKTGKWCRWCSAKPICPEYMRMGSEALETKPETMDAIELAAALRVAELLKPWIASVFELSQTEMERGVSVPGWKLVQKQSRRTWKDPATAQKIMRNAKVKAADMWKKTLISPAQAEKLNKKLYTNRLSELVESKSSGFTVVEDTDKRPAVTSGINLLAAKLETPNNQQSTIKS